MDILYRALKGGGDEGGFRGDDHAVSLCGLAASLLFVWAGSAAAAPGDIVRCSTDSTGTQGNNLSDNPSINGDGKHVLFNPTATNLVPGDTNGVSDVFRKELALPLPAITSITPDGGRSEIR